MMPIDFCASLEPCANAMNLARPDCNTRKVRLTVAGETCGQPDQQHHDAEAASRR